MNNISMLDQCANCGACVNVCPVRAIRVEEDGLFYHPAVDRENCIGCGKCVQVCPVNSSTSPSEIRGAWWGYHRDTAVVASSSSGGMFSALADLTLQSGGVVFGACMDEDHVVRIRSTEEVSLEQLRKSKYVESLTGDSFGRARDFLETGRQVLFCGTPCQIAGLMGFLGKPYSNLLTCDFSCGGLPSHGLFFQYLADLEERYHSKVTNVNFRPKVYGWSIYAITVDFANGKKYICPAVLDPFFCGFIVKHVNTRDYCYQCKFAEQHLSDIILADFWKYDQLVGKQKPAEGISLVLANSEKGKEWILRTREKMHLRPVDIPQASYNLKMRRYTPEYMNLRDRYLRCCVEQGLREAAKVIHAPSGWRYAVLKLRYFVKGLVYKFR